MGSLSACGNKTGAAPSAQPSAEESSAGPSAEIGSAEAVASAVPSASQAREPKAPPRPRFTCPKEMVKVEPHPKGKELTTPPVYCVDRYEATLVDKLTGAPITPYYPPERKKAQYVESTWVKQHGTGTELEKKTPLPVLPAWEKAKDFEPKALSRPGAIPQGYASEIDADKACTNAEKRLCSVDEWRTACRGDADHDFPYGEKYVASQCNIFGPAHPGVMLWDNPSINHLDPRFNLMQFKGQPLLRRTGATKSCASHWGEDAIYDMNGNIDEWVDNPKGMFVGGFYARSKKDGCQSTVTAHPRDYADYSTGIRCCKDAASSPGEPEPEGD